MTERLRWWSLACLAGAVMMAAAPVVEANTPQPPLHIGRIWTNPEYDGAEGWSGSILQYPGGIPIEADPWTNDGSLKRGWIGTGQKMGTYAFTTNWTDPDAVVHAHAMSYFFRSMNYGYPSDWLTGTTGDQFNYLYGGGVQVYNRFARPNIYVDETALVFHPGGDSSTVLPDHGGIGQYPLDIVDASLVSERAVEMWWRYIQGLEYRRTQYAYSYGSAHQDYIVFDISLTNNGISGLTEAAPVLTDQTLTNVVFAQNYDYRNNNAPNGAIQVQNDNHGMYVEPFGAGGHAAVYFRDGDSDALGVAGADPGNDTGDPPTTAYYNGHLLASGHVMVGPVFVSESAAAPTTNLPAQPTFRVIWGERGVDFAAKDYSPLDPTAARELITGGFNQMDIGVDARDDDRTADFMAIGTGGTAILGYGPAAGDFLTNAALFGTNGWDLGFNESVRIVQIMAAGGLDRAASQAIGQAWTARKDASAAELLTVEELALIASGKDTVEKAMNMAYWNVNGAFPAGVDAAKLAAWGVADYATTKPVAYGELDVPDAPRPPANIAVRVRGVNMGIQVRFSNEAELEGDNDTGVKDLAGYRVYRQEGSRLAPWTVVFDGPAGYLITAAADSDVPFAGREYWDSAVTPGVDYWYAVVAYDDGSQNWAEAGVSLESTRWWTWTGYAEAGITAGIVVSTRDAVPSKFALRQNAPNPFNPETTISFSLADAGDAKVVIYGPTGQVVRTLVNGALEAGQHNVTWDGMDNFGRPVASGVYIYRLTNGQNTAHKRMVLVR